MENLIKFFLKAGEVKRLKQRGLVLRGIKDPATVGGHSFRTALMAWVLPQAANSGLDTSRVIKIILLHDLVCGYAGDITPYEPLIAKVDTKDLKPMYEKWIRIPKEEKERFAQERRDKERTAFEELAALLPSKLSAEMRALWNEYEQYLTHEGRFVHQVHMLENHLQSLEYWQKDKTFPIESWWHEVKELITDPVLLELVQTLDGKFHGNKKKAPN